MKIQSIYLTDKAYISLHINPSIKSWTIAMKRKRREREREGGGRLYFTAFVKYKQLKLNVEPEIT